MGVEWIHEELADLVRPIEGLRLYPHNPRDGDIGKLCESLEENGQYKAVVVNRRTSEVLAGNHTLQAAVALGWREIAATFVDVDDTLARRIVLVDNRSSDVATYDEDALVALLGELVSECGPEGLAGTGYDGDDIDELLEDMAREGLFDDEDNDGLVDPENLHVGQRVYGTARVEAVVVDDDGEVECGGQHFGSLEAASEAVRAGRVRASWTFWRRAAE